MSTALQDGANHEINRLRQALKLTTTSYQHQYGPKKIEDQPLQPISEQHQQQQIYQTQQPAIRLQFDLAARLGCSPRTDDLREASILFKGLIEANYRRSECLYQLSLITLKLGQYQEAKEYSEMLLQSEPNNMTALSLRSLIVDRTVHDGISGTFTFISVLTGLVCLALKFRPPIQQFLSSLSSSFRSSTSNWL